MAQTKTIQLLRSSAAYANIATAKSTLEAMSGRKDGELVLARYWQDNEIKSLLGIYHAAPDLSGTNIKENETQGWTFIQDQSTVDAILDNLDFSTGNMSVGGSTATDDSIIVVGVAQNNGQLQAVTAELGSVKVNSVTATSATSKIAADQTLTENLGRLQGQIDDMDLTQVGGTSGDVVTAVSQSDGKVSASKSSLTDVVMTGYAADSTKTGAIAATDTLEQAFNKVENAIATNKVTAGDASITMGTANPGGNDTVAVNIKSGEHVLALSSTSGAEGLYTDLDLVKITKNLPTNVKERYQLLATDDTQIGTNIDIYKDSALQSVKLLHADLSDSSNPLKPTYSNGTWTDIASASQTEENLALCYAYLDVNGNTVVEAVPVGDFLRESEFGNGLQVTSGVVSVKVGDGIEYGSEASGNKSIKVKIDSTSESFLTVGANGVKLSGVQNAIDAVKVTTDNTGATYVNLAVDNATGRVLTLTDTIQAVSTADSNDNTKQGLAEASDVKSYVDAAVAGKNVTAEGDDYVSATAANNKVTVATDVQNLTFTQGSGSTDSTLSGTAQSLADGSDIATKVSSFTNARISEEIAKLDSSVAATAEANSQYSVLTGVTETDGKLTAKTEVTLAAVAKTGAAADVSVANSGNLLTATDVEGALTEIATEMGNGLNSVTSANAAIAVGNKANKSQELTFQVSANCAKQADGRTNMLTIEDDGLKLSDTWDCGVFD